MLEHEDDIGYIGRVLRAPSPEVSARMKRVRQRGTAPELAVAVLLSALGVRYRKSVRDLAGSPDFANKTRRWALFVHGCFWHAHRGCKLATVPKANRQWWRAKFAANEARDARKKAILEGLGYKVLIVWQCELADTASLSRRLRKELLT